MDNLQGSCWKKPLDSKPFLSKLSNSTGQKYGRLLDDLCKLSSGGPDPLLPLAPFSNNMNIFLLKRKRASKVFYYKYLFSEEKFTQLVENYSAGN